MAGVVAADRAVLTAKHCTFKNINHMGIEARSPGTMITLEHCKFVHCIPHSAVSASPGVSLVSMSDCNISRCGQRSLVAPAAGLQLSGGRAKLIRCKVSECPNNGIMLSDAAFLEADDCDISHTRCGVSFYAAYGVFKDLPDIEQHQLWHNVGRCSTAKQKDTAAPMHCQKQRHGGFDDSWPGCF